MMDNLMKWSAEHSDEKVWFLEPSSLFLLISLVLDNGNIAVDSGP